MDTFLQTFEMSDEKWRVIWRQRLKQFKIEILDNNGDSNYIFVQEFKLFGVKL